MENFLFVNTDGKTLKEVQAANIHDAKKKLPAGTWEWVTRTGDIARVKKQKATKNNDQ